MSRCTGGRRSSQMWGTKVKTKKNRARKETLFFFFFFPSQSTAVGSFFLPSSRSLQSMAPPGGQWLCLPAFPAPVFGNAKRKKTKNTVRECRRPSRQFPQSPTAPTAHRRRSERHLSEVHTTQVHRRTPWRPRRCVDVTSTRHPPAIPHSP